MLKGKTAIITGGSRGIGAAIVKKLAQLGCDIAIVYAGRVEAASALCEHCRNEYHVKSIAYQCDVADFDAVKELIAKIKEDFGNIDILVNNAGINRDGLIARMKEEDFDRVIDTNLKGTFNMIRHCSGIFIKNRSGRIVNISSAAGIIGNAGQTNYSASKAGIIGLTKSVARELAPRGITCNAIAPGFVATDMTKDLIADEKVKAMIPLGRVGSAEEIAEAAAFLINADYITGEILRVDGGVAM